MDTIVTKKCCVCGEIKTLDRFPPRGKCRDCRKGRHKKYAASNMEYRNSHKEEISAKSKQYYIKNKKKIIDRSKKYRLTNQEKAREVNKKWVLLNIEKVNGRIKKWRSENRDRVRSYQQNYRAKHNGKFTHQEWRGLCEKYDNKCLKCGKNKPLTVDHVVPISKGGMNTIDNLQPLCQSCNSSKNAKEVDYRPKEYIDDRLPHDQCRQEEVSRPRGFACEGDNGCDGG